MIQSVIPHTSLKSVRSAVAAFALLALVLVSCDNKGLVGSDIFPERTEIRIDTIAISGLQELSIPTFSGNLDGFVMGAYVDPLFGEIQASALFKVGLFNPQQIEALEDDSELSLVLRVAAVTGDTTATAQFDLLTVPRNWRGNTWRMDSVMTEGAFLTNFTIPPSVDSVVVRLPNNYKDAYELFMGQSAIRNFAYADSIFRAQDFGLMIVPRSTDKLVTISDFGSYLYADVNDTLKRGLALRAIGYTLSNTNIPALNNDQMMVISNYTKAQKFSFNVTGGGNGAINGVPIFGNAISRVEFVMYEDTVAMNESLPANHTRDRQNTLVIHNGNDQNIRFNILGSPQFTALRRRQDASFRINLTNYIKQRVIRNQGSDETFYFTYGFNDGGYNAVVLFNELHPTRSPKLIITTVVPKQ